MKWQSVVSIQPKAAAPEAENQRRVILLVTADLGLAQQVLTALSGNGHQYHLPIAVNVRQAQRRLRNVARGGEGMRPLAVILDETSVDSLRWYAAVEEFADITSVVALIRPERYQSLVPAPPAGWQADAEFGGKAGSGTRNSLGELIARGRVECVPRVEGFLPLLLWTIERIARRVGGERESQTSVPASREFANAAEFGEILRHEVNNPLTGILGNAELLLARSDQLPPAVVLRLQTIAELAIRLREIIRRVSNQLAAYEAEEDEPPRAG